MTAHAYVGTSWKMNHTLAEADEYAADLRAHAGEIAPSIQPFVIPPFTALDRVARALGDTRVMVGVQNVHWAPAGGWTGEISARMAAEAGAVIAEIGHSERREHFGEMDSTVNRKVHAALAAGLRPLVCVGDPEAEKYRGTAGEFVARQVKHALHGVAPGDLARVMLAYEPVWAIGESGSPATVEEVERIHAVIRGALAEAGGEDGAGVPVLYGGSVNLDNAAELIASPLVDGLFVGRAAWTAAGYRALLARCGAVLGPVAR